MIKNAYQFEIDNLQHVIKLDTNYQVSEGISKSSLTVGGNTEVIPDVHHQSILPYQE